MTRHPGLWREALLALAAASPDGWWRRFPFLPRPDPSYLRWRVSTAYGSPRAAVPPQDLIAYLEWRRRHRNRGR